MGLPGAQNIWLYEAATQKNKAPTLFGDLTLPPKKRLATVPSLAQRQVLNSEDMLARILEFAGFADRLLHCMLVCKMWYRVCRSNPAWHSVSIDLFVDASTHFYSFLQPRVLYSATGCHSWSTRYRLLKRHGRKLQGIKGISPQALVQCASTLVLYAPSLTWLHLSSPRWPLLQSVSQEDQDSINRLFARLRSLDLYSCGQELPPLMLKSALPHCQKLEFLSVGGQPQNAISVLMDACPPGLRELELRYRLDIVTKYPGYLVELQQWLRFHGHQLQCLQLDIPFDTSEQFDELFRCIGESCTSLAVLHIYIVPSRLLNDAIIMNGDTVVNVLRQGLGQRLRTLQIVSCLGDVFHGTDYWFRDLLLSCRRLTSLYFGIIDKITGTDLLAMVQQPDGLLERGARSIRIRAVEYEVSEEHLAALEADLSKRKLSFHTSRHIFHDLVIHGGSSVPESSLRFESRLRFYRLR